MKEKENKSKEGPQKLTKNPGEKKDASPEQHTGKEVNRDKSKNKTDLQVKNEVTGANLDAPPD